MSTNSVAECIEGQQEALTAINLEATATLPMPGSNLSRVKRSMASVARRLLPVHHYNRLRHVYRRVRTGHVPPPPPVPAEPAQPAPPVQSNQPAIDNQIIEVRRETAASRRELTAQQHAQREQLEAQTARIDILTDRIDRLCEQIERLKSRNTTLEGKLNIAMYGLPRTDEYASRLVSNPLLVSGPPLFDAEHMLTPLRGDTSSVQTRYTARLDALREWPQFQDFQPASLLDLGCGDGLVTRTFLDKWPSIQTVCGVDFKDDMLADLVNCAEQNTVLEITRIQTDLMTSLMALDGKKFDLICCVHTFERLSPHEQLQFLTLAKDRLNPNGVLYIETPNVLDLTVMRDLFWVDPQHLRPYSVSMLTTALDQVAAGKYVWGVWGGAADSMPGAEYQKRHELVAHSEYLELFFCLKNS